MQSLEYIDSYFKGEILPEQKRIFDERIQTDENFAEEVAFYLAAIQAARNQNAEDKKERFREIYLAKKNSGLENPVKRLRPYLASAAAILVAIIVGLYFYLQPQTPPQLAKTYIQDHFRTMSVQMGNNADEIQQGKRLYNDGKHREALLTFENVIQKDTAASDAREFAGITALQLGNYDKALTYFTRLESNSELHVNPGKFYHALTLMQRNKQDDKAVAKALLLEVVRDNLTGSADAREFLKHF